jgi:hypothetical protein
MVRTIVVFTSGIAFVAQVEYSDAEDIEGNQNAEDYEDPIVEIHGRFRQWE